MGIEGNGIDRSHRDAFGLAPVRVELLPCEFLSALSAVKTVSFKFDVMVAAFDFDEATSGLIGCQLVE